MNQITKKTRRESFEKQEEIKINRFDQILFILTKYGAMTAREVEEKRYRIFEPKYFDMNHVKPRLTELEQLGKVEVVDRKKDQKTNTKVAIYQRKEKNNERNRLDV